MAAIHFEQVERFILPKKYFKISCTLNFCLTNKPRLEDTEHYLNPTPLPEIFCVYLEMLDPSPCMP